ncbi:protein PHLOEM PROTEIN 2-LIKE A10-like [Populus alba x Populus x berolinensis]|uniref:Protein PHLOEM PROTEIN 2-LIKE A10-like n=1 Tax=Populus alba x Populus x berolinensis TaxID=444605 RepID=A0AAD6LQI0_9ROSI|nr:protein PHLOEM PROTEIN 2-LIKE A10-like [Populus alba x Populus x berolinensis]
MPSMNTTHYKRSSVKKESESNQIPNSFKQISKVARSNEFSEGLDALTQAFTVGILRGYQSHARIHHDAGANGDRKNKGSPSFLNKVFEKPASPTGSGFVSVIVGSFARNLVLGLYESCLNSISYLNAAADGHDSFQKVMGAVCGDKGRELIVDCIQLFVSTAVTAYLDRTMHINTYDEFFAGLTDPKHETKVRGVLVSICNGAIETLVKTSHQVLTTDDSNLNSSSDSPYLAIDQEERAMEDAVSGKEAFFIPSNRRLVLEVTGRVTFETVRSFLEFLLGKLYNGMRRCVDFAHEVVVDTDIEVVRYVKAKSSVIATLCISFCLHILDAAWILVPA